VIARATSLWGGVFDPIVILDGSKREVRGVQEELLSQGQYLRSQSDLLKAFDPDFLACFGADPLPDELKEFQHRTFGAARLDRKWRPDEMVSYFVDVWPALEELWEKEFKFRREDFPHDSIHRKGRCEKVVAVSRQVRSLL